MSITYVRRLIPDGGVRLAAVLDAENKKYLDELARSYKMSTSYFLDSFIEHLRSSESTESELTWLERPDTKEDQLPVAS